MKRMFWNNSDIDRARYFLGAMLILRYTVLKKFIFNSKSHNMSKYSLVIDALKQAQKTVNILLIDAVDESHKLKINNELQRSIDFISLITGTSSGMEATAPKLGPAKTIAGKKIEYKATTRPEDVMPDEFKLQKLKDKVEALYDSFLTISSEDLVKNYEDTVIRGVAKKAKMKVTKDNPAKLTIDFIDEIKMEIMTEQERQTKLGGKGAKVLTGDQIDFIDPSEPEA
jgi:hypothetical protein